jgi:large subunit ribosomal protein L10
MRKEDKAALVDEIADRLGDAEAIFAVDYRGISVPQAAELRARLAEADTTFRVVKNRLAKRATERAGTAELDQLFVGPTALAFVKGDAVTAAKAIATFGRQHDVLEYKGGLMDGAPLDPEHFGAIARLPGLDVLRGQLLGVVASPLTGLTRGLASMLSGLAVALGEIAEKGLVGGQADEPPAEAPAEPQPDAVPDVPASQRPEETADREPEAGEPAEEPKDSSNEEPAAAGDEVAQQAEEPAAPSEPEPSEAEGEASEAEASSGDDVDDDQGSGDAGVEEND